MIGVSETGLDAVTWRDRWAARRAGLSAQRASLAHVPPAPVTGDAARGAALAAGHIALGHARMVSAAGRALWAIPAPTRAFEADRQAFAWLDDLVAAGTGSARRIARAWTAEWLTRQGRGRGPGWTLPLAAARLERLVAHAGWLTSGAEGLNRARLERAFARHRRFALARLAALPEGAAGLAVSAQLVVAAARLEGSDALLAPAQDALDRACKALIDGAGAVPDRCPETLADVVCHLAEAAQALADAGLGPHPEHARALARAAPTLRALRHADGALARFHGGGAGQAPRLDAALSALRGTLGAARRAGPLPALPMGFARLARGPVTVIADLAAPPAASPLTAHVGPLAFEMTVHHCPLIVNCGAGAAFGGDWHEAGRQTASHSTAVLGSRSCATFAPTRSGALALTGGPGKVEADLDPNAPDLHAVGAHDGYASVFGLIHARRLDLALAGDELAGEDLFTAAQGVGRQRGGLPEMALRFHLHPDVDATLDPGGVAVRLVLPSRDVWHFTHDGSCTIHLDPGVYLEKTRAEPAASQQIVLSGAVRSEATSVKWRLTRDRGTPAFDAPAGKGTDT